jgi:hypothetical protein
MKRKTFSKYKGTGRMGLCPACIGEHCLVHLDRSITVCVFHAGTFLLNAGCWYEVGILILHACHYSVDLGPDLGILSFGLSFHHYFILDLSSSGHL